MPIMVDEVRVWGFGPSVFARGSCHLTTDGNLDELHAFAASLGMRREWFQDHRLASHYDLTPAYRELAVARGATFVTARAQAIARRSMRRTAASLRGS